MQTLLFSCPRQHPCPARRPTQRARGAQCLGMAAGKGGDAQEGRAADVPEKELRAEEGALPWQPGGEDQIYAVLEVAAAATQFSRKTPENAGSFSYGIA